MKVKGTIASAGKSKKSSSARPKKGALKNKSNKKGKMNPLPPKQDASWEEQSNYLDKFTFVKSENAGYLKPVNDDQFLDEVARSANAQKTREQVNISLEPAQFVQLKRIAKRKHLTPATLARAWLLDRLLDELTKS